MIPLRRKVASLMSTAWLIPMHAWAQGAKSPPELRARAAMQGYVKAWNSHRPAAWTGFLAEDIWYHETSDRVQRMRGRDVVVGFFGDLVRTTDIDWKIERLRELPDGSVSAVIRHTSHMLPKVKGKYVSSFESFPSFTRWRNDGSGWKMYYFTSHKGSALDAMKKDGFE